MFFLLFSFSDMNMPILLSLKGKKEDYINNRRRKSILALGIKVDTHMGLMKACSTV